MLSHTALFKDIAQTTGGVSIMSELRRLFSRKSTSRLFEWSCPIHSSNTDLTATVVSIMSRLRRLIGGMSEVLWKMSESRE